MSVEICESYICYLLKKGWNKTKIPPKMEICITVIDSSILVGMWQVC